MSGSSQEQTFKCAPGNGGARGADREIVATNSVRKRAQSSDGVYQICSVEAQKELRIGSAEEIGDVLRDFDVNRRLTVASLQGVLARLRRREQEERVEVDGAHIAPLG